ncbi:hypothetical protein LIER_35372 [Lithospermum erythrorhizon]|uniref:Uncharacterized protein n=1 Tax=Lithospermum erythrorhizon TaxID=34254 RepID=A0AAV3NPR1_LITER
MASSLSHIRSHSLPTGSHPTISNIEQILNKFKSIESSTTPSALAISNGLCRLVELYNSMDDLLNLPQTLQALSNYQNVKLVDELLDCPVKFLDICGFTRDIVSQVKENVRDLQSSLRRRKGDLSIESSITKHTSFRKKMKKDAKKHISILKKMDQAIESSILGVDQDVSYVIRVLREINTMSISVLQLVLIFLTASKKKSSKWSISRTLNKGRVACEGQQACLNELETVDDALCKKSSTLHQDLGKLETSIEVIERGLEGISRCLIRSRTSLLNIVSC